MVWIGAGILTGAALAYLLWRVVTELAAVIIPIAVAVLLAALLEPLTRRLISVGSPRWLAAALVLVGSLALLGGLLTLTINALITGSGDLGAALSDGVARIEHWLVNGPLKLSEREVDAAANNLAGLVAGQGERILSSVTATAAAVGVFLAGLVLSLFALYFFLYDGPRIWRQVLRVVPERVRERADQAGRRAFHALGGFTRATVIVALVDAVLIGIGLAIIGVPMVIPLASLVFLGGFVPFFGAFVAGLVAVIVALVSGGLVDALLVLGLNLLVQELEGDVLQPFLLGRAVRLHPLVVMFSIAVGVILAGIVGALFAVPLVLVVRSVLGGGQDLDAATPLPLVARLRRVTRSTGARSGRVSPSAGSRPRR
jgi:predicted PurR-regulated permease PerM